jgi:hypothetical protein
MHRVGEFSQLNFRTLRKLNQHFLAPQAVHVQAVVAMSKVYTVDPSVPTVSHVADVSLSGLWDFFYVPSHLGSEWPDLPGSDSYSAEMNVPGYWDDQIDRLRATSFWSKARFNPRFRLVEFPLGEIPPDASLPFLVGTGFYRKIITVDDAWAGRSIVLQLAGMRMEGWVWLDGKPVAHRATYSTPWEIDLTDYVKAGSNHEVVIAISNVLNHRHGCDTRGYQGHSAGLWGSISLRASGPLRITSAHTYPNEDVSHLNWSLNLDGTIPADGAIVHCAITDSESGKVLIEKTVRSKSSSLVWTTPCRSLQPWSDHSPSLYELHITVQVSGKQVDEIHRPFGLRRLVADGPSLRLNGQPVMLRGATEHAYFPLTTTAPTDISYYRKCIKALKDIGFNWLRFHTWVPSEPYMQAADELGMMIQVEPPVGFEEEEWADVLRTCRKHPCVVLYCCGNEEYIDEAKIEILSRMAELCHELAPDALFSPMEALRGVEYNLHMGHAPPEMVATEPFVHVPERLEKLKSFSDVFGQYSWGMLSYRCAFGNWREIDRRLAMYERPCLSHELGIIGNYLNLDLEERYAESRIGTSLFAATRTYLKREGLLHNAPLYYLNSCAWMRLLRKNALETLRKCHLQAGYDYLGGIDHHWHRTGYPDGILNEFYEMKPGDSQRYVLRYNAESVLLLDHTPDRNLWCGSSFSMDLLVSYYGQRPMNDGILSWWVRDADGKIHVSERLEMASLTPGSIHKLTTLQFKVPCLAKASKLQIGARLESSHTHIENEWDFWAFPKLPSRKDGETEALTSQIMTENFKSVQYSTDLHVTRTLNTKVITALQKGGRVLLLGSEPLPSLKTSFQPATSGRALGNLATVIFDHPLMNSFPHDGFCEWQFYGLLEGGSAILFDDPSIPFSPVLEVVSSFKLIRKQAAIFEMKIGEGSLLVCSLLLEPSNPAAVHLLKRLLAYATSGSFVPEDEISYRDLERWLASGGKSRELGETDQALDPNARHAIPQAKSHPIR